MGLLSVLVLITLMIVNNQERSINNYYERSQAFYSAQAGLEQAKSLISHNQNWYTDLKYVGSNKNTWLKNLAIGEKTNLQRSNYKIIREKDKNELYSIGSTKKATVLLKLDFVIFPFRSINWEEL